jgi:hypothetical protein
MEHVYTVPAVTNPPLWLSACFSPWPPPPPPPPGVFDWRRPIPQAAAALHHEEDDADEEKKHYSRIHLRYLKTKADATQHQRCSIASAYSATGLPTNRAAVNLVGRLYLFDVGEPSAQGRIIWLPEATAALLLGIRGFDRL